MVMSELPNNTQNGPLPGWAQKILGDSGAQRIEEAIADAESTTSGEIVPILVRRSSTVGHVPLASFSLLLLCMLLTDLPARLSELTGSSEGLWLGGCWLVAAGLALGLSRFDVVARILTPQADQGQQVDLRAQIEFYELEMSQTQGRTGILLFVSLLEHRAVVLADHSIADKLDANAWQELVDLMIAGVKGGDLTGGMTLAIQRCGELLAPHFPIADDDANELRDHLVVKE
jgi:putative membrane protein